MLHSHAGAQGEGRLAVGPEWEGLSDQVSGCTPGSCHPSGTGEAQEEGILMVRIGSEEWRRRRTEKARLRFAEDDPLRYLHVLPGDRLKFDNGEGVSHDVGVDLRSEFPGLSQDEDE